MASGEITSALRKIEGRGYTIVGNPSKILRATGYNGTWLSFMDELPEGCIAKDPDNVNRYTITHPDKPASEDSSPIIQFNIDKWTDVAVDFVLGGDSQPTIVDYQGQYGEHIPIIGKLASKIDDSIASAFYPPETEVPMEIYKYERGLYFTSCDNTFNIFGCVSIDPLSNTS